MTNVHSDVPGALDAFFLRLVVARQRVLMTDFDGTLAPFSIDRDRVRPFAGMRERLARLAQADATRLVIVSGRSASVVAQLLDLPMPVEIWGDHGWERRLPSGRYHRFAVPRSALQALSEVRRRSSVALFDGIVEPKGAGVAFHWRGRSSHTAALVRERAVELAAQEGEHHLEVADFDGGVEVRVAGRSKGDAVSTVLAECVADAAVAYLGDDLTDEHAFRALGDRGLGILVRPELRETTARAWLRPPEEVLDFFDRWHDACRKEGA